MDQARDLTNEFPELNEPEHAQRIIGMSREYAEMMGSRNSRTTRRCGG
jgi:hypothetical protein